MISSRLRPQSHLVLTQIYAPASFLFDIGTMGVSDILKQRALESGSRQGSVWAVALSFIVFTMFVMAVRIHVRLAVIKSVGVDDVFMIIGTVFAFGLSAASMISAWYEDQLILEEMTPMLQAVYSTRLLYVVSVMFVKLSLLVFYLRLDRRPCMRYTVYFLMFVVVGFSIASFFILTFTCYPPEMFWDMTGTVKGSCINAKSQQAFYDANGVLNIIIDLAIYVTPMPMFWNIQISLRQKLALTAIFGLGIVAVAAGCVRFAYVRLLSNTTDMYFYLADSLSWCEIEIYVAIFCGSASTFKILLRNYLPSILGSSAMKNNKYDNKYGKAASGSGQSRGYQGLGGKDKTGRTTISGGTTDVPRNDSEEFIIQNPSAGRIRVETEFRLEAMHRDDERRGSESSEV
ncbi:Uu.00g138910.m01.CDS01 [Anthostomella pinea]|uniref:Uu.00g138910.m01.CDS01 n=1 Tax=Anthostomella pinea TaxID=933095 RepID=A0AAI8VPV6_9PEZI|nr:Uu.00g138910.m01.CDS01 [Anthostomella pinea]